MLFNSLDFLLFFGIVLSLYYVLPLTGRLIMLLAASLYFYMYWNVPYVGLLLMSSVIDYAAGRGLGVTTRPALRRCWLLASLGVNLSILGFFKYYNFFLDSLTTLGAAPPFLSPARVLLPLGISFYTFQTMSYTIDVYRRRMEPERNPLRFVLYVCFFPQLVAGPIVRANHLLPQFHVRQALEWDNLVVGARRALSGFVKKVVIADGLATVVDPIYASPGEYSGLMLLLATYAFAFQIFCDFSGYSDIAIGVARMMGFRFLENFDVPYISRSIQEFWRRWHISLSTWLRDYLYIPLGGNRHGTAATYRNLLITMLLGGLWHGASWNFVIWGALHGVWLAIERFATRGRTDKRVDQPRPQRWWSPIAIVKTLLVFHGVCLTWVFFRARTFSEATSVLGRIAGWSSGVRLPLYEICAVAMTSALGALYFTLANRGNRHTGWWWWPAGVLGIVIIVLFGKASNEFIYFVF